MIYRSEQAVEILNSGFTGNGCGNRRWNTLLAIVLQWWAKVDFSPACLYHDAERNTKYNCEMHRLDSDKDFMLNLESCCERVKVQKYRKRAFKVARLFHWAVILNSYKTYYETREEPYV